MKYEKEFYINVTPTGFNAFIYQCLGLKPKATKMSSLWDLSTIIYEEPKKNINIV
jgi:hypothetical protein